MTGQSQHVARRRGLPRLTHFAFEHLLLLPIGAAMALVWVNLAPESYYRFSFASAFVVNDIALAIVFAVVAKEVVEATAPGGVLHPWRRTLLPVLAAAGAAGAAAVLHMHAVDLLDEPMLALGWPLTLATDLAFSYFIARIIFGQHPVVPFLMLLGIASNGFGFLTLLLYYPTRELHVPSGVALLAAAVIVAAVMRHRRVRSFWPYLLGAGGLSWYAFYRIGLHPALALLPVMPFLPHAARDPGFFVDASPGAKDTLSKFEVFWRYPAQVALFFFGLVNAGVPLGALEAGAWGLPVAVLIGKPLGVLAGAGAAVLVGLHLPSRVGWRELIVAGLVAAMGFSVGLFFCAAIMPPGQLRSELNTGVLLSLAGAPLAIACAWLFGIGRFARRPPGQPA